MPLLYASGGAWTLIQMRARHSNKEMRTQPKTALHSARRYLLLAKAQSEASEERLFMRLELRQNLQTLLLTAANGTRARSQLATLDVQSRRLRHAKALRLLSAIAGGAPLRKQGSRNARGSKGASFIGDNTTSLT